MSSEWGNRIRLKISGRSHAEFVSAELIGLPSGISISTDKMAEFMKRRRPGFSNVVSSRREEDIPQILSGLTDGKTDGTPMTIRIDNCNADSTPYEKTRNIPRPGHADYTAFVKWSGQEDMRGGGKFSGRMTAPLCVAGSVAIQILEEKGIRIAAHISSVGSLRDRSFNPLCISDDEIEAIRGRSIPVLSDEVEKKIGECVSQIRSEGDSVGGTIECAVTGLEAGIGDALFDGLESSLSSIVFAVPGVKGMEFGAGFTASERKGSDNNDPFVIKDGSVTCSSNNAGGILGGISTGLPLIFRTAFKPTPSIAKEQRSVNLDTMEECTLQISGRHDPCIVLRAVPVIEACAALSVLDMILAEERPSTIEDCREKINRIDRSVAELLAERFETTDKIGELKHETEAPVYNPEREKAVLNNVGSGAGIYADDVIAVYKEIMSHSKNRQQRGGD